jgi:hypothetical protein
MQTIYCFGVMQIISQLELQEEYDVDGISNFLEKGQIGNAMASCVTIFDSIRARLEKYKIEDEERSNENLILLDEDWRARIQTYIEHIRDVVRKAEIDEGVRERIMRRVTELSGDVEQNRTNLVRFGEVWVEITAAVGMGFNNLKPAVEILERATKALTKLREILHPSLPPSNTPKLPPPDEIDPGSSE